MAVRIVTDSTCDLPLGYIREHNLVVLPFPIVLGGTEYQIGPDPSSPGNIDVDEFFRRIGDGEIGTTAQILLATYLTAFREVLDAGDDLLYLCFSSGLTGTINSARLAAEELNEEYPDRKVRIVDTLSASFGEGMVVTEAVKKLEADSPDIDSLALYVEENKLRVEHWFTVNDLHYLHRGGRLSGSAAFAGSLLNIKPILDTSAEGKLVPREKVQGRKRAIRALADKYFEWCTDIASSPVYIGHGGCEEDALLLSRMIEERGGRKADFIGPITPVISCHCGVGTVALFFLSDKPRNP